MEVHSVTILALMGVIILLFWFLFIIKSENLELKKELDIKLVNRIVKELQIENDDFIDFYKELYNVQFQYSTGMIVKKPITITRVNGINRFYTVEKAGSRVKEIELFPILDKS